MPIIIFIPIHKPVFNAHVKKLYISSKSERQLHKLQWTCNCSVVREQQVFPLISSYTDLPQTYSWTYRSWSCRSTVRIAVNSRTEWSTAKDGRAERAIAEIRVDIHSKNHENSVLWTADNRKMDSREMNFILGSEASSQRNNLICPNIIESFFM